MNMVVSDAGNSAEMSVKANHRLVADMQYNKATQDFTLSLFDKDSGVLKNQLMLKHDGTIATHSGTLPQGGDIGDLHTFVAGSDLVTKLMELKTQMDKNSHSSSTAAAAIKYSVQIKVDGDAGNFIMADFVNPIANPANPGQDIMDGTSHYIQFVPGAHPVPVATTWIWLTQPKASGGTETKRLWTNDTKTKAVGGVEMETWIRVGALIQMKYDTTAMEWFVSDVHLPAVAQGTTKAILNDGTVDMESGYAPKNPKSVATKEFVEAHSSSSTGSSSAQVVHHLSAEPADTVGQDGDVAYIYSKASQNDFVFTYAGNNVFTSTYPIITAVEYSTSALMITFKDNSNMIPLNHKLVITIDGTVYRVSRFRKYSGMKYEVSMNNYNAYNAQMKSLSVGKKLNVTELISGAHEEVWYKYGGAWHPYELRATISSVNEIKSSGSYNTVSGSLDLGGSHVSVGRFEAMVYGDTEITLRYEYNDNDGVGEAVVFLSKNGTRWHQTIVKNINTRGMMEYVSKYMPKIVDNIKDIRANHSAVGQILFKKSATMKSYMIKTVSGVAGLYDETGKLLADHLNTGSTMGLGQAYGYTKTGVDTTIIIQSDGSVGSETWMNIQILDGRLTASHDSNRLLNSAIRSGSDNTIQAKKIKTGTADIYIGTDVTAHNLRTFAALFEAHPDGIGLVSSEYTRDISVKHDHVFVTKGEVQKMLPPHPTADGDYKLNIAAGVATWVTV